MLAHHPTAFNSRLCRRAKATLGTCFALFVFALLPCLYTVSAPSCSCFLVFLVVLGRLRPLIQSLLVDQSGRRQQGRQSSSCRHFTILVTVSYCFYRVNVTRQAFSSPRFSGSIPLGLTEAWVFWTVSCHSFFFGPEHVLSSRMMYGGTPRKMETVHFYLICLLL